MPNMVTVAFILAEICDIHTDIRTAGHGLINLAYDAEEYTFYILYVVCQIFFCLLKLTYLKILRKFFAFNKVIHLTFVPPFQQIDLLNFYPQFSFFFVNFN